jgi:hypothetical protein
MPTSTPNSKGWRALPVPMHRVAHADHVIRTGTEEVVGGHRRIAS